MDIYRVAVAVSGYYNSISLIKFDFKKYNFIIQKVHIMGFSRKKKYTPSPVEDVNFFEIDPPGFPVKFTVTPL